MSLSKDYLRKQVIKGISKMPCVVNVYREAYNEYGEIGGYEKVADLTGVLYADNSKGKNDSNLTDSGEDFQKERKKFLVDFNEKSSKVKKGDYITFKEQCYRISTLGEDFEVFFDMQVIENEFIQI